jgi:hypothetical protein
MPLEAHWQRQHTPLRAADRAERRVIAVAAGAVAVVLVAVLLVAVGHRGSARGAHCIDVTVPSTTGGASIHACGAAARRRLCAEVPSLPPDVVPAARAACRRADLPG